ncbi:MAG TPA: hypothetical protein VMG12_42180 [Polyangiaceae bacterium]|nr:hypothetical protein [Polyangiaceae bacterium]
MNRSRHRSLSRSARLSLIGAVVIAPLLAASAALATEPPSTSDTASPAVVPAPEPGYRLGAHAEIDAGLMAVMKQSAGLAGGVVYGPFRAGLSYATFLSNASFGGVPDGFSLRVNYVVGINAAYFIGQSSDDGLYVQAMFHIKQQGVTNEATGDHVDLNSLATGLELGYVWKVYKGLYVAPRVGALYYVKSPQGPDNDPVQVGDRAYDNDRHKVFDTYFIPTLSVGYSL